jgi:hypothetical protein
MLDDLLLEKFIHSFFGYGNYEADYWFVGMEEGGGGTLEEISSRLGTWDSRAGQELEDIRTYHEALQLDSFFKDPVVLQPTWAQLIRIFLAASGLSADIEAIKSFQKEKLGRQGGNTCLVELMPLPSPGTSRWFYSKWSRLPYLRTRDTYKTAILPMRLDHLKNRIKEYRPRYVVFYGKGYWTSWKKITGTKITLVQPYGFGMCRTDVTQFLVTQHPAARGARNEYFIAAGKLLNRV